MRLPMWDCRTFFASLGSVTGAVFGSKNVFAWAQSRDQAMRGFGSSGNVFEELGVTTVINGQGTMTVLGGSLPRPEVEEVMALGGKHFCSIPDLVVAAVKRIDEKFMLPEVLVARVTSVDDSSILY